MTIPVFDLSSTYQGGFTVQRTATRHLVVHHAAALYPTPRGQDDVASIARYHTGTRGWPGIGYHEVIAETVTGGPLAAYLVSDPGQARAHVFGRNGAAFGICAATNFGDQLPPEAWIAALAARLAEARRRWPQAEIVGHTEIALPDHATSCPGRRWLDWKPRLLQAVEAALRDTSSPPSPATYSELSSLEGAGVLTAEDAAAWVIRRGCVYVPFDVRVIANAFAHYAQLAGLNFDLVWAQVIHETSAQQPGGQWWPLSSWWAQRPRRNGGGVGVTGATQLRRPATPARLVDGDLVELWAPRDGQWYEGISFPSWDHAARAHVGRLVLYTMGAGRTSAQQELARYAQRVRPLARHGWGSAPTLKELGRVHNRANVGRPPREHVGWASPGDAYGARVAAIATTLRAL